jgi:hypothetical protein
MKPPKARIDLTAEKSQCNLGEQVKGTVRILSEEEFEANQAVVWLTCNESIKRTQNFGISFGPIQSEHVDNAIIYQTSFVLFGIARVPRGYDATFPYTLNISISAKETQYSIDHSVKWLLYAVLLSKDRPNIQTPFYEIQVARPQISQPSPTIIKEVQREVVLIPCAYCSGLMPQTSIFCPNCGARRKAS